MADWKHYMNSGYAGCQLLAYARDHVRMRDVRIYKIPGEFDDVGITDGTDTWIAPVKADVFSVNVKRLMDDIAAGKQIPKPEPLVQSRRRQLLVEEPPQDAPKRSRRALLDQPEPTPSFTQGARRARLQA